MRRAGAQEGVAASPGGTERRDARGHVSCERAREAHSVTDGETGHGEGSVLWKRGKHGPRRAMGDEGTQRAEPGRRRPPASRVLERGADSHIEKRWSADAWRLVGVGFCSRELQCTTSLDVRAEKISEECRRSPPARVHEKCDRAAGAEDVGRSPSPEGVPRRAPEACLPAPSLEEEGGACPRSWKRGWRGE